MEKQELTKIWNSIIEEYYTKTNKKSYKNLISKEKQKWILRNKLMTCSVALLLFNTEIPEEQKIIKDTLNYFGYTDYSYNKLESTVLKEKSRLDYIEKNQKLTSEKEEINFWKLLAQVENALGRQLDIEKVTLSYWIEILQTIKDKNIEYGRQRRNTKIRHNI